MSRLVRWLRIAAILTTLVLPREVAASHPLMSYVVLFEPQSAALRADASRVIEELVAYLSGLPDINVELIGSVDTREVAEFGDAKAQALAVARAEAVRAALIDGGIDPVRIRASPALDEPAVRTGAGVPEQANRYARAELSCATEACRRYVQSFEDMMDELWKR
jgi:hypothetical protein